MWQAWDCLGKFEKKVQNRFSMNVGNTFARLIASTLVPRPSPSTSSSDPCSRTASGPFVIDCACTVPPRPTETIRALCMDAIPDFPFSPPWPPKPEVVRQPVPRTALLQLRGLLALETHYRDRVGRLLLAQLFWTRRSSVNQRPHNVPHSQTRRP